MVFFFISDLAVSVAFKLSMWVLEKTCNGIVCIASMSIAAAVSAYSGSTASNSTSTQPNQPNQPNQTNQTNQTNQYVIEMKSCVANDDKCDFQDCVILSHDV
jgi:hypothetical protein